MLLKKALLSMFLFCPLVTWGQLLSVTATLTDSDSVVWVNGNCSVEIFSPNGQAFYNGTAVPTGPQTCAINGSGVLTTSIYNTSTITPTGAMYRFSISSATSAPASQFLTPITAANQTSNLSALITAPRFNSAIAFVYGYADVEALHGAPGNQYFKTTSTAGQRIWSGSAWTSSGGGGSSGISGLTLNCIPKAATATTITGCSSASDDGILFSTTEALVASGPAANKASSSQLDYQTGSIAGRFLVFGPDTGTVASMNFYSLSSDSSIVHLLLSFDSFGTGAFTNPIYIGSASTPVPVVDTQAPTISQAVCIKSQGPPVSLGTCSTVVGAGGACTCN